MKPIPYTTRKRYARETAAARRALARASSRANQSATWCMFTYIGMLFAMIAAFQCGRKADKIEQHVLTVAQLLQQQTTVLLANIPEKGAR